MFRVFATVNKFSLWRERSTSQTTPDQFAEAIVKFYQKLVCKRNRRKFQLKYIADIDQTTLPFVFDAHSTHNDRNLLKKLGCQILILTGMYSPIYNF